MGVALVEVEAAVDTEVDGSVSTVYKVDATNEQGLVDSGFMPESICGRERKKKIGCIVWLPILEKVKTESAKYLL